MLSINFSKKVYLLVTLLVTGIMASAASYFLITQNHALKDAMTQQARSLSVSLAEGARVGVILEDKEFIEQVASGLLGLPNLLFIDVYLSDRTPLAHMGDTRHQSVLPEDQFRQASRSGFFTGKEVTDNERKVAYRDFISPILLENHEIAGFVRLGFSTASITKKWRQTLVTTVWVTLLLIFAACLIVYFPVKHITRPVKQLSEGAVKIGQGDLNFEIIVDTKDEIGQLASNFNGMAESLRQQTREIHRKTGELQNSESKFRELFENIGQPLYINDMDGKLIDCNQAMVDLFGYASRKKMVEAIQKASFLFLHPEDRQHVIQQLLDKGEIKGLEVEFKKSDGTPVNGLLTSRVRINEAGEAIGFEGMIQDITELRQLEEQLLHSQKMESIGTLVGGIAHDFNNMLAGIMGSLYLARLETGDNAEVTEHLEQIETLSNRAADMIRQLLTFARKDKIKMRVFPFNPFLKEALKLARSGISEEINVNYQICPDDLMIRGDSTQLQQVIMNLLNNARDAVSGVSQPVIDCTLDTFSATKKFKERHSDLDGDQFAHLTVRDNGCGISEATLDKVFDPFFTTKGVGRGTGLGLAMAYGAMQSHGGLIEVESEVDKGTAFHIYLPLQEHEEEVGVKETPVAVKGHGETILLVDDEEDVRTTGCKVLSALGYEVLEAADGRQAVEVYRARQDSIGLVIMDVVMPEMGGVESARQMREITPKLPVIFATGYDREEALGTEEEVANSTVLSKPFAIELLSQYIDKLLNAPE